MTRGAWQILDPPLVDLDLPWSKPRGGFRLRSRHLHTVRFGPDASMAPDSDREFRLVLSRPLAPVRELLRASRRHRCACLLQLRGQKSRPPPRPPPDSATPTLHQLEPNRALSASVVRRTTATPSFFIQFCDRSSASPVWRMMQGCGAISMRVLRFGLPTEEQFYLGEQSSQVSKRIELYMSHRSLPFEFAEERARDPFLHRMQHDAFVKQITILQILWDQTATNLPPSPQRPRTGPAVPTPAKLRPRRRLWRCHRAWSVQFPSLRPIA